MSLREHFMEFARRSRSIDEAFQRASMAAAIDFGEMVDNGVDVAEALNRSEISDLDSLQRLKALSDAIRLDRRSFSDRTDRPDDEGKAKKTPTITGAFYIVVVGGGVKGVPTPECMNAHLPPHGQRNRDDYERAWEECTR